MRRRPIIQLSIVLAILILASSNSTAHALREMNDSPSTNHSLGDAKLDAKPLVLRINPFIITFPCILLFTLVFVCNIAIVRQQRLHIWIVLATSGSFALRFIVRFLSHPSIIHLDSNLRASYQICVTFGETFGISRPGNRTIRTRL